MQTNRFEQLDAVRAFAVLAVVASHTFDVERHPSAEYGAHGVQLFFVVSGFLITGILIDARRGAAEAGQPMATVMRAFYARRILRIFPIYYLTLAVAALIGVAGMRETLGWNLAYLSNWQIAFDGEWGVATHTWSLAVEEQFYVLWPLVVLLAPRRMLPWAVGAMLAVAVATRAVLTVSTDMWTDGIAILTPSVLDTLGLGALLALLWRVTPNVDRIVAWIGGLALGLFVVEQAVERWAPAKSTLTSVTSIWWALLFVWIVHHAARGFRGPIGRVLAFRPLIYIGTVSYGVYLFHLFVVPATAIVERETGMDLPVPTTGGIAQFVVVSAVSIAAAALSWTFFEGPINRRKHHFPYVRRVAADTRTAPAPLLSPTLSPAPDAARP